MSQPYFGSSGYAGASAVDRRSQFIVRTYNHVFGAIVAFIAIEFALFGTGVAQSIAATMLGGSWLLVLGGFMVVSWIASYAAGSAESKAAQYGALALYVVAEAIIFVPLLFVAQNVAPGAIQSAGIVTMLGFAGLTGVAFVTRKDFSFLRGILMFSGVLALVAIVGGVIFGFHLGTWFSVAMVGVAGASILYNTSNIIHRYPEDRYVGAALQLFSSIALMFWYVLRIFISSRD